MSARKPCKRKIAGMEEYASMEFASDGGAAFEAMGTPLEFVETARQQFPTLKLASAVLRMDHNELERAVRVSPAGSQEDFTESMVALRDQYRAYADVLDIASLRVLCAMARVELRPDVPAGAAS